MNSAPLDPRITPARADLAAAFLEGRVCAARFVEGTPFQASAAVAAIRAAPDGAARLEDQLLFGEGFTVFEEKHGWAWGQSARDGYVGYVDMAALSAPPVASTDRVAALRTYIFSAADLKSAPLMLLSLNAKVRVETEEAGYAKLARTGWVPQRHLAALDRHEADWVAVAERFVGTPYLWGGRESLGLDCSGLLQSALEAGGTQAPRDADMLEGLGTAIPIDDPAGLRRGDMVFWKGHCGVMVDGMHLLHANAFHMQTVIEPLQEAAARIAQAGQPIRAIKRLGA